MGLMVLKDRLRRLEEGAEGFYQRLTLLNSNTIFYTAEEAIDAMSAAIHQESITTYHTSAR